MRLLLLLALTLTACGRTEPVRYPPDWGTVDGADGGADNRCTISAVDAYTLPPVDCRPIDVLFVVDDSCSMANDQQQLSVNMRSFFSTFQSNQVDFHVGVVTTDVKATNRSGRLVAPFVTNQTPDATAVFQRMVLVGTRGSGDERALEAAQLALTPPLATTANAGFVRPEADFALVIVGDEDDHSRISVPVLADSVKAVKSDATSVTVGSVLLSCSGSNNWRIAQFTRAFGERGIITRCTQDYATTLRTIAGRALNKQCIVGLREPLDTTRKIDVTFNGQPTGWRYAPPEDAYPQGSIELEPCPETGGRLELTWSLCTE